MEEILQSLPDPMKLDQSVWFILVLVLVLLVILNKSLFKPIVAILAEREEKIKEGIQIKASSLKTVEESQEAYQRRLTEARKNAYQKRVEILKESQASFDVLMTQTREEASGSMKQAVADIDRQVTSAQTALEREVEDLSEKMIHTLLNQKPSS